MIMWGLTLDKGRGFNIVVDVVISYTVTGVVIVMLIEAIEA